VQSDDPGSEEVTFGMHVSSITSSAPAAGDFAANDYLSDSLQTCSSTQFTKDGNTVNGASVDPTVEAERRLWFLVRTPKSTSDSSEFTARLTIQANLP